MENFKDFDLKVRPGKFHMLVGWENFFFSSELWASGAVVTSRKIKKIFSLILQKISQFIEVLGSALSLVRFER